MSHDTTTTVRIPLSAKTKLKEAAAMLGVTMADLLTDLADEVQAKGFFMEMREAYAKARNNPRVVKEEAANLAILDGSLTDGLGEHLHEQASKRRSLDSSLCGTR